MFNKEYPKSCTMIDTSFKGSYINIKNPIEVIFGCRHWRDNDNNAVVSILHSPLLSTVFSIRYCPPVYGFRGSVYVQ